MIRLDGAFLVRHAGLVVDQRGKTQARKHRQRDERQPQRAAADDDQAGSRRNIRQAEKAVTKAVDHIEERIEARQRLPERRQRMDRIENAREKRQWQDEEILECGELVELLRPDSGDQPERGEERAAQKREGQRPQWVRKVGDETGRRERLPVFLSVACLS